MNVFNRIKKIQATEGQKQDMDIIDGLTLAMATSGVPGTENTYRAYSAQVTETYRKYNGTAQWGSAQCRTIVDTRAAFIAGEGISISTNNEVFAQWAKTFLKTSKLSGSAFFSLVMGTEMTGRAYLELVRKIGALPLVRLHGATLDKGKVVYVDETKLDETRSVCIRTGGDGTQNDETTTRVGLVLTECETYDRALKDLRRANYYGARITPTWKTDSDAETTALKANLSKTGWKVGQGFIGKATLAFATPGTGASDNLKSELASAAKTISAVTAVPVHWLGHTDLMSNRATADDLYQTISNGTSRERVLIAEGLYELLVKAQTLYIDAGGTDLPEVCLDFTVTIPSVDYGRFESMVRALSLAYADKIISADDYRSYIPGIDPLETKKALAQKSKEDISDILDKLEEPEEPHAEDEPASMEEPEDESGEVPASEANAAVPAEVQQSALNGAQIEALSALAKDVASGALPKESAIAIARASFPTVKDETLLSIFNPIKKGGAPDASGNTGV